ncbi:MAG: flagellar hook-basal body complex protein FliE [Pirellulales bacterium]|nr:flagellar hook-basal body complex protein FliE [Pirellulales bacterium]
MNPILNSQLATPISLPAVPSPQLPTTSATSFKDMLVDSIRDVNSMQQQANQAVKSLMTDSEVNPAEVLTSVQKADLTFRLMMQMQNKMMQVYQEVKEIKV